MEPPGPAAAARRHRCGHDRRGGGLQGRPADPLAGRLRQDRRGVRSARVSFVSVTQQFNTTTSMGRLTLNVLLSFAQFEREVTGERIRDKIAASKKKGMWMGGLPPLGYDANDRKLVVNEAEADTVRHIFRRYIELKSVRLLKADLDAAGIVSKARTVSDGRRCGRKPLARGALYLMLQHCIYRARSSTRRRATRAKHVEALVDEALCGVRCCGSLCPSRAGKPPSAATSFGGLLFLMSDRRPADPTYATSKGPRYRYYVSRLLLAGKAETRPAHSGGGSGRPRTHRIRDWCASRRRLPGRSGCHCRCGKREAIDRAHEALR